MKAVRIETGDFGLSHQGQQLTMTKPIRVSHQRGPYRLEAEILPLGEDLVVSIWGGTAPHVGALALAIPRPSLKDPTTISSTASVLARMGHKEDDIVKKASERISASLNRVVAVAAGIHWDHIPDEGIEAVRLACDELVDKIIDRIQREKG